MPAIESSRSDVVGAIKQETVPGGSGRAWLRKALVASQVALSVVVAWGLFRLFAGMTSGHPILGFLTLASLPATAASGLVAAACLAGLLGATWSVRRAMQTE